MIEPSVSFVIPTLNAERYLPTCLAAIRSQDYPAGLVEILVCDGGSTDATITIAEKAGARIIPNARTTAEAGKADGIAAAHGEILCFVDSDNEIIGTDWLRRMLAPFAEPEIFASEVLHWAYVRHDGIVNRYCALTGVNDPTSLFVGNYGRWSWLTDRWTGYPVKQIERDGWLDVQLQPGKVPTMGANGYLVRAEIQRKVPGIESFLFDIDAVQDLVDLGYTRVARVHTEIRHQFARDTRDFARKTRRRAQDYLHHRSTGERTYRWRLIGVAKFVLATVLVVPVVLQSLRGYGKRHDAAWFFHPVACWITLLVYGEAVIESALGRGTYDRSKWKQ